MDSDTGALTSATSEEDLNKIKLLSNGAIKDTGPAPNFQIMVANGQLERPIGTVLLQFEVADFQFQENFIVMKVLPMAQIPRTKALNAATSGLLSCGGWWMKIEKDENGVRPAEVSMAVTSTFWVPLRSASSSIGVLLALESGLGLTSGKSVTVPGSPRKLLAVSVGTALVLRLLSKECFIPSASIEAPGLSSKA